jgi:hypothetical protein
MVTHCCFASSLKMSLRDIMTPCYFTLYMDPCTLAVLCVHRHMSMCSGHCVCVVGFHRAAHVAISSQLKTNQCLAAIPSVVKRSPPVRRRPKCQPLPRTACSTRSLITGEGTEVGPQLNSNKGLAQFRIDCSAGGIETQEHETESQFQSTYSNNTDNPCSHRLSAVSNIAAAGPGGDKGSYGHFPVCESPSAEGEAKSRVRPDNPTTHEDVMPSGDDRSWTIPGHASANYDRAPTFYYAPSVDHYPQANVPGSSTSMNQPINLTTNQLYQTTIPGCNTSRNLYHTPTTGDDDATISSHNGNQGWFGPGVKGGLPLLDAGHYNGTGKGKGTGGGGTRC